MLVPDLERKLWKYGLPRCEHRRATFVLVLQGPEDAQRKGCREQCADCGKLDSAPHKLGDHLDILPVDLAALQIWADKRAEASEAKRKHDAKMYAIRSQAKTEENAEWFDTYGEYLDGDDWAYLRRFVLHRDQYQCQAFTKGCTRKAEQVHHLSYKLHNRLGAEPAYNLVAICRHCHAKITEAERAAR